MKEPKELKVGQKHHLLLCYLMLTMTYSSFQFVITCQILIIWVEISHGRCLSQSDFLGSLEGVEGSANMIQFTKNWAKNIFLCPEQNRKEF